MVSNETTLTSSSKTNPNEFKKDAGVKKRVKFTETDDNGNEITYKVRYNCMGIHAPNSNNTPLDMSKFPEWFQKLPNAIQQQVK